MIRRIDYAGGSIFSITFGSANLSVAAYDVFIGVQLLQPHWTTRVQFLSRDSHFTTETEFSAVCKTGGNIDINRCGIHKAGEPVCCGWILSENCVTVSGGVLRDVLDGLSYIANDFYGENVIKEFGVKILFACCGAGYYGCGFRVKAEFHRRKTSFFAFFA